MNGDRDEYYTAKLHTDFHLYTIRQEYSIFKKIIIEALHWEKNPLKCNYSNNYSNIGYCLLKSTNAL